ncbi:MAG: diphthamide biosynthesis enzyme Dph2 [Candidatus Thermoplasmatota archaeon]|nr:diphthamide biosynthesis enzyme Dph2 [Candidatus Thermoplasmatota archaeon]
MKIAEYTIDLERAAKIINKKRYRRVALQFPEGLKNYLPSFVAFLQKHTDASIIIAADPCFGACDFAHQELQNVGVDFVIQLGHEPIPSLQKSAIPSLFLTAQATVDVLPVVQKALPLLQGKKIGIVATTQHVHYISAVEQLLKDHSFEPMSGRGDKRIAVNGQILGCNFSAATSILKNVDSFLFIGSGTFHPLGLVLAVKKPVIAVDPYTKEVKTKELEEFKDMVLRQRYGAIARSKDAQVFGILVGLKKGQQRIELADKLQQMLTENHKQSYLIALDTFSPTHVQSFTTIDCFVSTACPRIAIDEYLQYKTPIITPIELEIVLGIKTWDDYSFDQILSE